MDWEILFSEIRTWAGSESSGEPKLDLEAEVWSKLIQLILKKNTLLTADTKVDVWCDLSLFGMKSRSYSQLTWEIHLF